jgi:hypothetical protein
MKKLYIVRVERSQTGHDHVGVWAHSIAEACSEIERVYPGAYYYGIIASTVKIIN